MSATATEAKAVELYEGGAMSVATAVREFGVSRTVLYDLMGAGRLPYSQLGRKRVIARKALAALLAQSVVGLKPESAPTK